MLHVYKAIHQLSVEIRRLKDSIEKTEVVIVEKENQMEILRRQVSEWENELDEDRKIEENNT